MANGKIRRALKGEDKNAPRTRLVNKKNCWKINKERRSLLTEDQVAKWASEFDIDQQLFIDTFLNSFYVNSKVEAANKLTRAYKTDGVPTIVVDGKFRTKVSLAGGHDELIDLINYLASLAEKERSN